MMKILDLEVTGIRQAVGQNNSGNFSGLIMLDLLMDEVTFNPVGPEHYKAPGVVILHSTSNLYINRTTMKAIKHMVTAHYLTLLESGLSPEEYARELTWTGSGLGTGDELRQMHAHHLNNLTSGVV